MVGGENILETFGRKNKAQQKKIQEDLSVKDFEAYLKKLNAMKKEMANSEIDNENKKQSAIVSAQKHLTRCYDLVPNDFFREDCTRNADL